MTARPINGVESLHRLALSESGEVLADGEPLKLIRRADTPIHIGARGLYIGGIMPAAWVAEHGAHVCPSAQIEGATEITVTFLTRGEVTIDPGVRITRYEDGSYDAEDPNAGVGAAS